MNAIADCSVRKPPAKSKCSRSTTGASPRAIPRLGRPACNPSRDCWPTRPRDASTYWGRPVLAGSPTSMSWRSRLPSYGSGSRSTQPVADCTESRTITRPPTWASGPSMSRASRGSPSPAGIPMSSAASSPSTRESPAIRGPQSPGGEPCRLSGSIPCANVSTWGAVPRIPSGRKVSSPSIRSTPREIPVTTPPRLPQIATPARASISLRTPGALPWHWWSLRGGASCGRRAGATPGCFAGGSMSTANHRGSPAPIRPANRGSRNSHSHPAAHNSSREAGPAS